MQARYGTGTVVNKNGKWLWVGYYVDENGKIKRPTKSFKTEKEALLYQAEQISKTTIQKEKLSQDLTLSQVFEIWKKETTVSETTKKNIIANFNKHIIPKIGNNKIKHLNTISFQRYLYELNENGLSTKTTYNIYTDLKTIVNYALSEKIIYENSLDDFSIEKPRSHRTAENVLSMSDYNKIMLSDDNRNTFYYNAILFLAETGIRVSELAIKESDIHEFEKDGSTYSYLYLERSIKRVLLEDNKTTSLKVINDLKTSQSERKIYLNGFASYAVESQIQYKREHKIKSPFIFTTSNGSLIEQRNLLRSFHSMCDRVGVKRYGLHSLRKCFINRSLSNGIQPFDLAKFTGHSVQTMYKYYHELNDDSGIKIINASENR